MLDTINNFRKTQIYNILSVILLMTGSAFFYYECQRFIFKDRPFQVIDNMKAHPFVKRIMIDPDSNNLMYSLNKDGTLTIHRLSDRKNFIVKLDKGEK